MGAVTDSMVAWSGQWVDGMRVGSGMAQGPAEVMEEQPIQWGVGTQGVVGSGPVGNDPLV